MQERGTGGIRRDRAEEDGRMGRGRVWDKRR